ncbi:MAG: ATPase [Candidatus Azobacteroides sp.]|nr:ATPase [Candidatus Azobacteroides sp.]
MIVLADSGSTKTHWCFILNKTVVKEITTAGINPFYQTQEEIQQELYQRFVPYIPPQEIREIYFYGAGCVPDKIPILRNALTSFFHAEIHIHNDLLASCRALSGSIPGIVAILGTGSNSCLYDGKEIVGNVSPLGFILGDEGSGAVLGKMLVADILKNQLPESLIKRFFVRFDLTPAKVMERVYRSPFPNRFLAGLSVFLHENMHEYPVLKNMVEKSFSAFFERNILQYGCGGYAVHFSGSIAYYYQDILKEVAEKYNRQLGKVEMYPMPGLIEYHSSFQEGRWK